MRRALPLLGLAALLLAGCGGRALPERAERTARDAPGRPQLSRPAPAPTATTRQCLTQLAATGARFTPLPDRMSDAGCRAVDTIRLDDIGVPTTNLTALTCPLSAAFAAWVRHGVRPAARAMLGSEVVRVETFGSYSCRTVYSQPGAKLSEHAFANAIDVSAFVLADGRRVLVKGGWRDPETGPFLRAIHRSACRRFGTVLGPDYNAAHDNHFHLDMGKGGPRPGPNGPEAPFCR